MDSRFTSADLVSEASNMKAQEVAAKMSVAVLKQQMDAAQQQAQAMVQMMQQSPMSPDGRGAIVDRFI
jgi:predicted SnoaL-like aldol condensation-catalyzing enzyme